MFVLEVGGEFEDAAEPFDAGHVGYVFPQVPQDGDGVRSLLFRKIGIIENDGALRPERLEQGHHDLPHLGMCHDGRSLAEHEPPLAQVRRDHDLGLGGVGQDITGLLRPPSRLAQGLVLLFGRVHRPEPDVGVTSIDQFSIPVCPHPLPVLVPLHRVDVGFQGEPVRNDELAVPVELGIAGVVAVASALLREARQAVPDQLVRDSAIHGEPHGRAGVLEDGLVAPLQEHLDERLGHLLVGRFLPGVPDDDSQVRQELRVGQQVLDLLVVGLL